MNLNMETIETILMKIAFLVAALYLAYHIASLPKAEVSTTPTVQYAVPATPSKAKQAVLDEGYMNPVGVGKPILSCGQDDSFITSELIEAENQNGKKVTLTVCCGLIFKGCTIRH